MSGPPPKPTRLKALAGNPGKRPLNRREPVPLKPDKPPYAPRFLTGEAQKEWHRMVRLLMGLGLYTEVDMMALAMYCQAAGRWIQMETALDHEDPILVTDKGYEYQNPRFALAAKYWDQMRKMLSRFGLSPADRTRLSVEQPEEQDELAELLFRRGVSVGDGK